MCKKFIVRGRVQGVFFRASTRDMANTLNVAGHAINLPDGSVEVVACGASDDVQRLGAWLQVGPPMAAVTVVEPVDTQCIRPDGFRTQPANAS